MAKALIERILETLGDGASDTVHLFAAIHLAGYGASKKAIERKIQELENKKSRSANQDAIRGKRHSFYSMLSYLKKDGLIEKSDGRWSISQSGKKKLRRIQSRPNYKYSPERADSLTIIIFDVPEKERQKRRWLRDVLTTLGFRLVQKSVWAGRKKIPQEFLEDLKEHNMLDYVDIFTVTKSGSLRSINGSDKGH